MTCGGQCSTSSQLGGFCLGQSTMFCDRELLYMALSSLKMTLRLLTLSGISGAFLHMRPISSLNRRLKAHEQTLADMDTA